MLQMLWPLAKVALSFGLLKTVEHYFGWQNSITYGAALILSRAVREPGG